MKVKILCNSMDYQIMNQIYQWIHVNPFENKWHLILAVFFLAEQTKAQQNQGVNPISEPQNSV